MLTRQRAGYRITFVSIAGRNNVASFRTATGRKVGSIHSFQRQAFGGVGGQRQDVPHHLTCFGFGMLRMRRHHVFTPVAVAARQNFTGQHGHCGFAGHSVAFGYFHQAGPDGFGIHGVAGTTIALGQQGFALNVFDIHVARLPGYWW